MKRFSQGWRLTRQSLIGITAIVLVRAVKAVFAVALYRFGTEQTVVGPYSEKGLRSSVGVRPRGVPV